MVPWEVLPHHPVKCPQVCHLQAPALCSWRESHLLGTSALMPHLVGTMHHTTATQGTLKYFFMLLLRNISEAGIKKKKKNPMYHYPASKFMKILFILFLFPHTHFAF